MRGKFLVVTGGDASGKATQTQLLTQRLRMDGLPVYQMSFPIYNSPSGKVICRYLGRDGHECEFGQAQLVPPRIASTWYALNRAEAQGMMQEILDRGTHIICDRYAESNMAHQASKISDMAKRTEFFGWLDKLEFEDLKIMKPHGTIFLHVPYGIALELIAARGNADGHESCEEHMRNTELTYLHLAEVYHWAVVSCAPGGKMLPIDVIADCVYQSTNAILNS